MNYTYLFKICLIGDAGVGKTALSLKFVYGVTSYEQIGVSFASKSLQIQNQIIKYSLFDLAAEQTFKSIIKSHFRNSVGIFLMYDITRRQTFQKLPAFISEAKKYMPQQCVIMIIGNKNDLVSQRSVSEAEAKKFAEDCGFGFMEVCALDSKSIQNAVIVLSQQILNKINNKKVTKQTPGIKFGSLTKEQIIAKKQMSPGKTNQSKNRKCVIF